ncbi:MAG TPA: hypothetical protein VNI57_02470, partial [Candidatus Saccharimonadales bacterium]|nr:hypothetical protein [Candidatus Saccharimonadales bacterium]
ARCRHVISENDRVLRGVEHLAHGEWEAFGRLVTLSHRSLRDDFEVSHPFIDRLVDTAGSVEGVLGSRITGAGFGGCTVSLVARDAIPEFRRRVEPLLAGQGSGAGVIVVERAIEAGPLPRGLW